jgi:hypothetical protein
MLVATAKVPAVLRPYREVAELLLIVDVNGHILGQIALGAVHI